MCLLPDVKAIPSKLIIAIGLSSAAIGLLGCGGKESYGTLREEVTGDDLKHCESKMEILFPAEAKPLGIWKQAEPDESIKLKLGMTRAELQVLIQQSPFKDKPLTGDSKAAFGPNVEWWDPGKKKNMTVGFVSLLEQGADLSIGIDDQGGDEITVYLVWVASEH